jgi:PEP-CTERM motif
LVNKSTKICVLKPNALNNFSAAFFLVHVVSSLKQEFELMKFSSSLAASAALRFFAGLFTVAAMHVAHAAGINGQGTWETTLQGRDLDGNTATFEAYYDTDLDITWLDDVLTNVTWNNAQTWVSQLDINGVKGWRLPTMVDIDNNGHTPYANVGTCCPYGGTVSDWGYNVDTSLSEMAHMHHVTLGNKSEYDTDGNYQTGFDELLNTGPFINAANTNAYWTNVELATNNTKVWSFNTFSGFQDFGSKLSVATARAVRSGDVISVPEPSTYALMGLGLVAVLMVHRQRKH